MEPVRSSRRRTSLWLAVPLVAGLLLLGWVVTVATGLALCEESYSDKGTGLCETFGRGWPAIPIVPAAAVVAVVWAGWLPGRVVAVGVFGLLAQAALALTVLELFA